MNFRIWNNSLFLVIFCVFISFSQCEEQKQYERRNDKSLMPNRREMSLADEETINEELIVTEYIKKVLQENGALHQVDRHSSMSPDGKKQESYNSEVNGKSVTIITEAQDPKKAKNFEEDDYSKKTDVEDGHPPKIAVHLDAGDDDSQSLPSDRNSDPHQQSSVDTLKQPLHRIRSKELRGKKFTPQSRAAYIFCRNGRCRFKYPTGPDHHRQRISEYQESDMLDKKSVEELRERLDVDSDGQDLIKSTCQTCSIIPLSLPGNLKS